MKEKHKPLLLFSDLFCQVYEQDNYLILEDDLATQNLCAVYFSSSGIYYPTDEHQFENAFIRHDRYEWYKNRIPNAKRHIFVRDIAKRFYAYGINSRESDIESVLELLKKLTKGYRVVTIGSSSGGYAAAIFGCLLSADLVYCFSGYFNLKILDKKKWGGEITSCSFLSRIANFSSLIPDLSDIQTDIVYLYPSKSNEDIMQAMQVANKSRVYSVAIKNNIHGVCIGAYNLKALFNMNKETLLHLLSGKKQMGLVSFTRALQEDSWLICLYKVSCFYFHRIIGRFINQIKRLF